MVIRVINTNWDSLEMLFFLVVVRGADTVLIGSRKTRSVYFS